VLVLVPCSKARLDAARGEVQALQMTGLDEVREGDYQVQVHLIEARDLAAVDLGGTSDPSVYVYIMGQKKRTRIIPKVPMQCRLVGMTRCTHAVGGGGGSCWRLPCLSSRT
jgi:hypothetical protein